MVNHSYKEYVDSTNIVIDADENFRYLLKIPFLGSRTGNEKALVVMMNPSKADKDQSDATINNVLRHIYEERKQVKDVIIANLYPIYETDSSKLTLNKVQAQINFKKILGVLPEISFALLGWGKPKNQSIEDVKKIDYFENANNIINMLQKAEISAYQVGELRDKLFPKHIGRSPKNVKMTKLDLDALKTAIGAHIKKDTEN